MAGTGVKGKDCPDVAKQLEKLDAFEQDRFWVGTIDVKRAAKGSLSLAEAHLIHGAYESRATQPTVKWTKPSSFEQDGCKSVTIEVAGPGSRKMTVPILKYTRDSLTIDQLNGAESSGLSKIIVTLRFKNDRIEMDVDTTYKNYPLFCNSKAVEEKDVSLSTNNAFSWSPKAGIAPKPVPATPNFDRLAKEAKPIVDRFYAECNRPILLDGGVTPSTKNGGSAHGSDDAADAGADPAN